MKVTKILSVFLAIIMLTGCLSVMPVSAETLAEGGVVYLSANGSDDKNGLSSENAVATVAKATKIIADANVAAATIKIVGTFTTDTSVNTTETAHANTTITYTGDNGDAQFKLGRHFALGGPVVFENLQIGSNNTANDRYIYYLDHKLVMDEGLSMVDSYTKLRICAGYGNITSISNVDVTVNSGTYNLLATADLNTCTVNGDVNVAVNKDANITTLYVGGNATTSGKEHTIKGKTTITVNGGAISNIFVGEGKNTNKCTFEKAVLLKINGGKVSSSFGVHSTCNGNVTFSEDGCIVDFSGYKNDAYAVDKWKNLLNKNVTDEAYKEPYHVTDCSVAAMQKSNTYTEGEKTYRNVRFIIGVRDYTEIETASVTIVAKNGDTEVAKKTDIEITTVYDSVVATVSGLPAKVTASEMGANYLMAITVNGIPSDVTVTSFEVTPNIDGSDAPTETFSYSAS